MYYPPPNTQQNEYKGNLKEAKKNSEFSSY